MQVNLSWVAALNANADTEYRIEADKATPGTFVEVVTQPATERANGSGVYTPFATTLDGAIDDEVTALTLNPSTNFSEGDVVVIDREPITLGAKASNTFSDCIRGKGGTVPRQHADGATVYKAHESFSEDVDFGNRNLIRYRIIRVQGTDEAVATESLIFNPPKPPTNDFCTVFGALQSTPNVPQPDVPVTLALGDSDNFMLTGELIRQGTQSDTTDADGFFSFFAPKDIARAGGDPFTLTVGTGDTAYAVELDGIPDKDSANFLTL